MPRAGAYREILNSDAEVYGGSNVGNSGMVVTTTQTWMGREESAVVTLPPLGFIVLQLQE
jgi:1,4-alpha-glucan branching enzyme